MSLCAKHSDTFFSTHFLKVLFSHKPHIPNLVLSFKYCLCSVRWVGAESLSLRMVYDKELYLLSLFPHLKTE